MPQWIMLAVVVLFSAGTQVRAHPTWERIETTAGSCENANLNVINTDVAEGHAFGTLPLGRHDVAIASRRLTGKLNGDNDRSVWLVLPRRLRHSLQYSCPSSGVSNACFASGLAGWMASGSGTAGTAEDCGAPWGPMCGTLTGQCGVVSETHPYPWAYSYTRKSYYSTWQSLSQIVPVSPGVGVTYLLSFWYQITSGGGGTALVQVTFGGQHVMELTDTTTTWTYAQIPVTTSVYTSDDELVFTGCVTSGQFFFTAVSMTEITINAPSSAACPSPNILQNPCFSSGSVTGWGTYNGCVTSCGSPWGSYCGLLATDPNCWSLGQSITVNPGTTYVLSLWSRNALNMNGELSVSIAFDSEAYNQNSALLSTSGSWRYFEVVFVATGSSLPLNIGGSYGAEFTAVSLKTLSLSPSCSGTYAFCSTTLPTPVSSIVLVTPSVPATRSPTRSVTPTTTPPPLTLLGSYSVSSGPPAYTAPATVTCVQRCQQLFPLATQVHCSTSSYAPSRDAFYACRGQGCFDQEETFSNGATYSSSGVCSAYVQDGSYCADGTLNNYCWGLYATPSLSSSSTQSASSTQTPSTTPSIVLLGSYYVSSGPSAGSQPATVTCQQECQRLFPLASNVQCSTGSNYVSNNAFYACKGQGCFIQDETYSNGAIYNSNGVCSAYVADGSYCSDVTLANYCWGAYRTPSLTSSASLTPTISVTPSTTPSVVLLGSYYVSSGPSAGSHPATVTCQQECQLRFPLYTDIQCSTGSTYVSHNAFYACYGQGCFIQDETYSNGATYNSNGVCSAYVADGFYCSDVTLANYCWGVPRSPSLTPSVTPSTSITASQTPTASQTQTTSASQTASHTRTSTASQTASQTQTSSASPTSSGSQSPTKSSSLSASSSQTRSASFTSSQTLSGTASSSQTPSPSASSSATPVSVSPSLSGSRSPVSVSPSPSQNPSVTQSPARPLCEYTASDGSYYDLSALQLPVGQPAVGTVSYPGFDINYSLNICNPAYVTGHFDCNGAAVCAEPRGFNTYVNGGTASSMVISDGVAGANRGVTITYSDGSVCGDGVQKRTVVYFTCAPYFIPYAWATVTYTNCQYTFNINAYYACPQTCRYSTTDGSAYDFTPLRHQVFSLPNNGSSTNNHAFYVSLCGSGVGGGTTCNGLVGVCQDTDVIAGVSGGVVYSGLSGAPVTISYTNGDLLTGSGYRSAYVVLACDPTDVGVTLLSAAQTTDFLGRLQPTWAIQGKSKFACGTSRTPTPSRTPTVTPRTLSRTPTPTPSLKPLGTCTYTLVQSGEYYDLGGLTTPGYYTGTGPSGTIYTWNLCATVPCAAPGAAVCKDGSQNGGLAIYGQTNYLYSYYGHGPFVNYYQGSSSACTQLYSRVVVRCSPGALSPIFVEVIENTCSTVIVVDSKAGCPVMCNYTASDGSRYELSPLRQLFYPYTVVSAGTTYNINICGPVGSGCGGDASVCVGTGNSSVPAGSHGNTTFADGVNGPSTGVVLHYQGLPSYGTAFVAQCTANTYPTSTINVQCDPSVSTILFSNVVVQSPNGCNYVFSATSKYGCPLPSASPSATRSSSFTTTASVSFSNTPVSGTAAPSQTPSRSPAVINSCTYKATDGSYYDLSGFTQDPTSWGYSGTAASGKAYEWNICANTRSCATGVAVCQNYAGNFGALTSQTFSDGVNGPANGVNLTYVGTYNANCNGNMVTIFSLQCSPCANGVTVVSVVEASRCVTVITMQSQYACPIPCAYVASDGSQYDLSPLRQVQTPFYAGGAIGAYLNLCGPAGMSCGQNAAVCVMQMGTGRPAGIDNGISFTDGANGAATGVTVTYPGSVYYGSKYVGTCDAAGNYAHSIVSVNCDPTENNIAFDSASAAAGCGYLFTARSKYACPLTTTHVVLPLPSSSCSRSSSISVSVSPSFSTSASRTPVSLSPSPTPVSQTASTSFSASTSKVPINTCTYTASDGSFYDLSGLTLPSGTTYSGTDAATYPYAWNICGTMSGCGAGVAACQLGYISIGQLGTKTFSDGVNGPASGVTLLYTGGSSQSCSAARVTYIRLVCDPCTPGVAIVSVVEGPICVYTFTMASALACPVPSVYKAVDGSVYNLAPLRQKYGPGYSVTSGSSTFFLNICGPVASGCAYNSAVCKVSGGIASYGGSDSNVAFSSGLYGASTGVTVTYGGRSNYGANTTQACAGGGYCTSILNLLCDTSVSTISLNSVVESPAGYTFTAASQYACPTTGAAPSPSASVTCSRSVSPSTAASPTRSASLSAAASVSLSISRTNSQSRSLTKSSTGSQTASTTPSGSVSATSTSTSSSTVSPSASTTPSPTDATPPAIVALSVGPRSLITTSSPSSSTITATLDHVQNFATTISLQWAGTAALAVDYTRTAPKIVIAAGALTASVTIQCITSQTLVHLTIYAANATGAVMAPDTPPSFGFTLQNAPPSTTPTTTPSVTPSASESATESASTSHTPSRSPTPSVSKSPGPDSATATTSRTPSKSPTSSRSPSPTRTPSNSPELGLLSFSLTRAWLVVGASANLTATLVAPLVHPVITTISFAGPGGLTRNTNFITFPSGVSFTISPGQLTANYTITEILTPSSPLTMNLYLACTHATVSGSTFFPMSLN